MENYQCHIIINNRTSEKLKLLKSNLAWGKFREGPAADVGPKEQKKAFVATGSLGPAGTEGWVTYQVGDAADVVLTIKFDVPTRPLSNNTVSAEISNEDVSAKVEGLNGSGSTESCTVRVIDSR